MGYSKEYPDSLDPIVLDIETAGLPNAADYLEPIPDAVLDDSPILVNPRLVDQVKIAADLEQKRAARDAQNAADIAKVEQSREARESRLGLDRNVGCIVAIGTSTGNDVQAQVCRDEREERQAIASLWVAVRNRTIVGFNCKSFDLPFLIQRSRYLGLTYPTLDLGKYTRKGIVDLFSELTFNEGTYDTGAMRRTLHAFCKRFGIPVNDVITGAQIPALVAAGEWDAVAAHVKADVELTVALARKLGVLQPAVEEVAL